VAASIAVDLRELTFIDCALGMPRDAAAKAGRHGAEPSLLGATGQMERVLELTGSPVDFRTTRFRDTSSPHADPVAEVPSLDGGSRGVSGEA
jgi:anti-anti-sigma regulatory factor